MTTQEQRNPKCALAIAGVADTPAAPVAPFVAEPPADETEEERQARLRKERLEWAHQGHALEAKPRISLEEQLFHGIAFSEWLVSEGLSIFGPESSRRQLAKYRQLKPRDRAMHDLYEMVNDRGSARKRKMTETMKAAFTEEEFAEWKSVTPANIYNWQES